MTIGLVLAAFALGLLAGLFLQSGAVADARACARGLQRLVDAAWHADDIAARCEHGITQQYRDGAAWAARIVARALSDEPVDREEGEGV